MSTRLLLTTTQAAVVAGVALAFALCTAGPANAQGSEHQDTWREQGLVLSSQVVRGLGLPAGRYELRLAEPQPTDGTTHTVFVSESFARSWTGRPTGCPAATYLRVELPDLWVSSYQSSGAAGALPRLRLRLRSRPACSLILAPVPGIEGNPIGTSGSAAPAPGIEGSDVSTSAAAPAPSAIAGNPPSRSLRQRVEGVVSAARTAQSAFPPAAEVAEELRPDVLTAWRTVAALAGTSVDDPRLVQKRLEAVSAATPVLILRCAEGRHIPSATLQRCSAAAQRCRSACGDNLCTCDPVLAGCIGRALRERSEQSASR